MPPPPQTCRTEQSLKALACRRGQLTCRRGAGGGGMANASCRESCWDRLELRLVLHAALPFLGRCPKDTPAARCRCERTRPFTPTPFVTAKHQKRPERRKSCRGGTAGSGAAVKRNGDSLHELAGSDFQNVPLNEESQNAQRAPGHNNENPVTCRLPQTRCGFGTPTGGRDPADAPSRHRGTTRDGASCARTTIPHSGQRADQPDRKSGRGQRAGT